MLVFSPQSHDYDTPREPSRRRGGIVWQPHTEGFATIAYRDGRAIAGISGPWSNQYVLIWWRPSQPIRQVEVFDSLDEAKFAVAQDGKSDLAVRVNELLAAFRRDESPRRLLRPWTARLWQWLRPAARNAAETGRRRFDHEETDLSGLHLRALR
jgi:hypothetical protein